MTAHASSSPDRRLLIDWTSAFLLATVAACIAGVIAFAPLISRMVSLRAFPATTMLLLSAAAFGALHGFLAGAAQARVLRRRFAHQVRFWTIATVAGASLAWTACMLVNLEGVAAGLSTQSWNELVVLGGLAFGATIGVAQWIALRRSLTGAAIWIPANGVAWLLGSLVVLVGLPIAERTEPAIAGSAIVIATVLAASLVAGVVPAFVLMGLADREDRIAAMRIRRARFFTCPGSGKDVTATIAEDMTGRPREVESCSAFADPHDIQCERKCLDTLDTPRRAT